MLEMLDIPFSHSGSLTHAIALDKALTKKVWRFHGLPTPRFLVFGEGAAENVVDALRFPVLVKPNSEGSSKGLFNENLIEDPADLLPKWRRSDRSSAARSSSRSSSGARVHRARSWGTRRSATR